MTKRGLFISSVQREFAAERRAIKTLVERDPVLSKFFDVFLFEDLPPRNQRPDEVYLAEVDRCDVYVGLIGNDYGYEDAQGISPTEREFDRATVSSKRRLLFVREGPATARHAKVRALLAKAGAQVVYRRFADIDSLTLGLHAALAEALVAAGALQSGPFEEQPCPGASMADIDAPAVADFITRARQERRFPLTQDAPAADALVHLHLLQGDQPSRAAMLLFGREPQRFMPGAELRCMHFHGHEVQRPVPNYQVFTGRLFEQLDHATDFVLAALARGVGTRAQGAKAPVRYELPPEAIREAVVNAVAHRDYAATGQAVQVSVFSNRVEVASPGALLAPLTLERLRGAHPSVARNPRLCEVLFQAHYIEKYGTGTLMMIDLCREYGRPEPRFEQRDGEFVVTLWRDWLTPWLLVRLGLSERQQQALQVLTQEGRLTNARYQAATGASRPTAKRDLEDMVAKGVLVPKGAGRGAHYELPEKWLGNGSNGSADSGQGGNGP